MGWTGIYVESKKVGVERIVKELSWEEEGRKLTCLKTQCIGEAIYAALREEKDGYTRVFAAVIVIDYSKKENLLTYKHMTENEEPFYWECPQSILKLLTETDCENAKSWRSDCQRFADNKRMVKKMAVGQVLCWPKSKVDLMVIIKRSPAYQFKTDWFEIMGKDRFYSTKSIPYHSMHLKVVEQSDIIMIDGKPQLKNTTEKDSL